MAPPPPSSPALSERLKRIMTTLQFGWFVGHLTLLLCVSRYGLSYITFNSYSTAAQISYRLAFVAAAVTYGIVVFKAMRARLRPTGGRPQGAPITPATLLTDENVQYLGMALVWLFSRQIPLALLPFSVYSVFHVATYSRTVLIPTVQPPKLSNDPASPSGRPSYKGSPIGDYIGKFVKDYYDSSMTLVALLEIFLWFRVSLSALTFTKGAWFLLVVYTAFLRARYAQSIFVQNAFHQQAVKVDALVSNQSVPPAVRQGWQVFKGFVEKAADLTDVSRYLGTIGGAQPGTKKAQ